MGMLKDLEVFEDYPNDIEKEDKLELFYGLIKFITIGVIICFTIASIMFQLL